MNNEQFIKALKSKGIELNEKQLKQFDQYFQLLVEWNGKMNLTAITEKEAVYEKHFYDSLSLAFDFSLSNQSLCDVGSGAGFPAIPLKIAFPNLKVTVVDSLDKRIHFLDYVIKKLELKEIKTNHARAEAFSKEHREQFDIVTARAVARLNILIELCAPLVKVDGYMIAMKGSQGKEELEEAKNAIQQLGLKLDAYQEMTLPNENAIRTTVFLKKVKACALKYPRNYGQIKKKPL